MEGLHVVSGGMSRRSARLTRRGIRAHVRRRGKLVGVEATASCWEYVARGGILAFGIGVEKKIQLMGKGE